MVSKAYETKMELKRLHHRQKKLKRIVKDFARRRDKASNKMYLGCMTISNGTGKNSYVKYTTVYKYFYYNKKFLKANKTLQDQRKVINTLRDILNLHKALQCKSKLSKGGPLQVEDLDLTLECKTFSMPWNGNMFQRFLHKFKFHHKSVVEQDYFGTEFDVCKTCNMIIND